jgi:F-box protein 11
VQKQNAFDSARAHCDSSVWILNGWVLLEGIVVAERNPVAFMSYLRRVDQHDHGRLTELRKRLEGEVQLYTGEENFAIFQDREDIRWGQQWRTRIENSLNDVTFLIPIITPGLFRSEPCRDEIELFLEREKELGRSDLILPIYYIDFPDFDNDERRRYDPLMVEIAKHQYEDWRDLRHESLTSATIGRSLSKLAVTFRDTLSQRRPATAPQAGQRSGSRGVRRIRRSPPRPARCKLRTSPGPRRPRRRRNPHRRRWSSTNCTAGSTLRSPPLLRPPSRAPLLKSNRDCTGRPS